MVLLIGTDPGGVFRIEALPFDANEPELVLDCGNVTDIRTFPHSSGIFAASENGLYRSLDDGYTWEDLEVPVDDSEIWSVLATSDETIYAGTNDPHLYHSHDGGGTWTELTGFRELPSRRFWESPVDSHRARLRVLESPPNTPERLIAGIESGGIHDTNDNGKIWNDHRDAITDDIHHVVAVSSDVYFAATGYLDLNLEHLGHGHDLGLGGIYRTTDAGNSWTRLDVGNEYSYVREVLVHDGSLYFCGAKSPPPDWRETGIDTALFESSNLGRTFEQLQYPGDSELIEAWTVADDRVIGGSGMYDTTDLSNELRGRIVMKDKEGEYITAGRVPYNVSNLEYI